MRRKNIKEIYARNAERKRKDSIAAEELERFRQDNVVITESEVIARILKAREGKTILKKTHDVTNMELIFARRFGGGGMKDSFVVHKKEKEIKKSRNCCWLCL